MAKSIHEIHSENYLALPMALRQEVYEFLIHEFPPDFFERIRLGYLIFGEAWWMQDEILFNMNEGLAVRTSLRKAGYSDYDLPCGNWDLVYVPVMEAAAGLRPVIFAQDVD